MIQSILHKEWRKAWRPALVLVAGNAAAAGQVWLSTRQLFRREHAEVVWYQTMQLGLPFFHLLKYLPLATGAALAMAQFLPEMRQERLRLSLHLPVNTTALILVHLLAGLVGLAACLAVQAVGLWASVHAWFPREMTAHAFAIWGPWALAGVAGYLGMALALLEPSFLRRLGNLTIAAGAAWLFLLPTPAGQAGSLSPAVLLPLLALAVLHAAGRYRNRRADA
ncbi:hypothetical protein [Megalodesulfovibrio gigas]|uniref:Uncharacterized protein n=1 Tax=Megalodesulfovibrio gigas (strain ATCC 19364 / DSM 1382 / NCIMB 9332 / VKM B-1759) TaxID=1121448 RepID=T2GFR1_MEGG1|nr:hypothetical protein [Megalodesulfovibrio gigas]AGW14767.1 hypothetical protein DGI_3049 [Megalodesulfovibrio gigas DSM 1382 = ATCC 19364]